MVLFSTRRKSDYVVFFDQHADDVLLAFAHRCSFSSHKTQPPVLFPIITQEAEFSQIFFHRVQFQN